MEQPPPLTDADEALIRRCLRRSIDGAYFPGDEFHTLIGLHRHEMETIVEAWPEPPTEAPEEYANGHEVRHVAVSNVLNSLLGYPHGVTDASMTKDIGATRRELADVLSRWRQESDFDPEARGFFDRLM